MLQQDGAVVWEEDPQGADRAPPKAQEASPEGTQGLRGFAPGPDPTTRAPVWSTCGRRGKEGGLCRDPETHFVKYFAQCFLTACVTASAARQKI